MKVVRISLPMTRAVAHPLWDSRATMLRPKRSHRARFSTGRGRRRELPADSVKVLVRVSRQS